MLVRERRWRRITVVTSTFHVSRSRLIFGRAVACEVRFVGAGFSRARLPRRPRGDSRVAGVRSLWLDEALVGEEAAPPGTFGHYAPVPEAQQDGPAPGAGESAAPPPAAPSPGGEASPPGSPADPESR